MAKTLKVDEYEFGATQIYKRSGINIGSFPEYAVPKPPGAGWFFVLYGR